MFIECMTHKEKLQICNKLGEIARTFIAEEDFSKSAQLKFYKKVLRYSMESLDDSPTIGVHNEEVLVDETHIKQHINIDDKEYEAINNLSITPILMDNIMFRSVEHAYYFYKANQDYVFLAKILAEDKPARIAPLYTRALSLEQIHPVTDLKEDLNIMQSLLYAKIYQHPEVKNLLFSKGKSVNVYYEKPSYWKEHNVEPNILGTMLRYIILTMK